MVFPLDSKLAAYFRKSKTAVPKKLPPSRMPTPAELQRVAKAMPNVKPTMINKGALLGQIALSPRDAENGPWALLDILENTGDDEPCHFSFEKGWPNLIIAFLIRLTGATGPLVLVPDSGEMPLVVEPTTRVEEAMRKWDERDD